MFTFISHKFPYRSTHFPMSQHIAMPSPLTSPQASRLLWRLQGPLAESIFVVWNWDTQDPPREPFATQNLTGNISWHAISQESLTEPKIKTISVHVDVLKR